MMKDLVVVRLRGGGKIGRDTTSGRSQRQKKPYQVSDTHQNSSRGVFCGNLSYETTWQALKDHMRQAGVIVRADVLIDRATGRSKGCGIVEYETASSARKAIRELHETELDGRSIFLREDRDDVGNRGNSSSSSLLERALSSPRSDAPSPQRRVYVGNLSWGKFSSIIIL
jgi:RNA recognition motif-containing protein